MNTDVNVIANPLAWLLDEVRADAGSPTAFAPRTLEIARWLHDNDRQAFDALEDELDAAGFKVLPWRTAVLAAAPSAPSESEPPPGAHNSGPASTDGALASLRVVHDDAAPTGIIVYSGADAARDAREAQREAERDGAPDPLDGLAERIRDTSNPLLALDPQVIKALQTLRADEPAAYQSLRGKLKGVGVLMGHLEKSLDADAKHRRAAAKEAECANHARATELRREAVEAQRAAGAAKRPDLAAHFNQAESNGARFTMEPGQVVMEAMTSQGIKRTTLANFSAPIVAHTRTLDTPGAKARATFTLSVVLKGGEEPREVDIEADRFARMEWVEPALGPRAVVAPGKGLRDNLRAALGYLSAPVTRERCAFTGWTEYEGQWVYLHAAGAIGEGGAVEGLAATPPAPVDRFALPAPPTGDELARSVEAVVELLSVEPARVTVPLVALAFHAPLGGSRCAVHVNGRADLGKSVRASLVQRLYGAGMNAKAPPASWADGSTAIGISQVLARAGDALVTIDDLRVSGGSRDEADAVKVDRVLRAHFNGAAPLKGRREGGGRTDPASRCDVLSTGETLPKGPTASTLNRVVTVELDVPLPPNIRALDELASAGVLAAGMAAYLRWLAPQVGALRPRVRGDERAAALRWGLTAGDRASELMGGLCLGMEYLFAFLKASGVSPADVARHEQRARVALLDVAREHGVRVAEEGAALRFIGLIGQALRSGGVAHVVAVKRAEAPGRGLCITTPADPHLWGYQRRGDDLQSQGKAIGYLTHASPGVVFLEPAAALAAAKRVAADNGHALGFDRAGVGAALHAAGMLERSGMEGARHRPTTRIRTASAGPLVEVWAVKLSALGFGAPDDDGSPDAPPAPDDGTGPAPDEVPEFPDDIDPFTP